MRHIAKDFFVPEDVDLKDVYFENDRTFIGKIIVHPISGARKFSTEKVWACISVTTYKLDLPKINGVRRVELLQQTFPDWDQGRKIDPATGTARCQTEVHRFTIGPAVSTKSHSGWHNAA